MRKLKILTRKLRKAKVRFTGLTTGGRLGQTNSLYFLGILYLEKRWSERHVRTSSWYWKISPCGRRRPSPAAFGRRYTSLSLSWSIQLRMLLHSERTIKKSSRNVTHQCNNAIGDDSTIILWFERYGN